MAHKVLAPITGTIWKITTSPGTKVGEEEVVIIMESMKMEMPIEAGRSGKVFEIHIKEGMAVTEGQLLLSIHED